MKMKDMLRWRQEPTTWQERLFCGAGLIACAAAPLAASWTLASVGIVAIAISSWRSKKSVLGPVAVAIAMWFLVALMAFPQGKTVQWEVVLIVGIIATAMIHGWRPFVLGRYRAGLRKVRETVPIYNALLWDDDPSERPKRKVIEAEVNRYERWTRFWRRRLDRIDAQLERRW